MKLAIGFMVGITVGSAITYALTHREVEKAYLEGAFGEASSMAELLAKKVDEANGDELKSKILLISCISAKGVMDQVNSNSAQFTAGQIIKERAQAALEIGAKNGIKQCN
jgi:hypothetical protein